MRSVDIVRFACVSILGLATAMPAAAQAPKFRHLQGGLYEGSFFLDEARGWCAGDSRIHWTDDGGFNWNEATFVEAETNEEIRVALRGMFIVEDPFTTNILGFCVGDRGVVLATDPTDPEGHRWVDLNPNSRVLDACGEPATLYDIFMLENTGYLDGWCVGEATVSHTSDGGLTWTDWTAYVDSNFFGVCRDAYVVHFFSDPGSEEEFQKGIIAAEYGRVYTTADGGTSWTMDLPAEYPCPSPNDNLEWWGMEFEDPTDPTLGFWLVGGVGFNNGYLYHSSGMNPTGPNADTWIGTWEQMHCYQFENPAGDPTTNCGPSTQYGVTLFGPGHPVSSGYGSQLLDFKNGASNFDPCAEPCTAATGFCNSGPMWVEEPLPNLGVGQPFLRTMAKVSPTRSFTAGAFGRRVLYDTVTGAEDVGSVTPSRIEDAAFLDASTGVVFGQGFAIHFTVDGGETWEIATTHWPFQNGLEGGGIAFDSSGTYGVVVGDNGFLGRTVGTPQPWTEWDDDVTAPTGLPSLNAVTFVPGPSGVAFAVGASGALLTSTDHGQSWALVPGFFGAGAEDLHGVSFATPSVGYIVGENAKVYMTTNGGQTWGGSAAAGQGETIFDVETWGNGSSAIAVGQLGSVWTRSAQQPRFVKVDLGLEVVQHLYDVEELDSGGTLWVGGEDGVVLQRDPLGDWSKHRSGTTLPITKLAFQSGDEGYAIAWMFVVLKYQ